jgi:macrolide-specific efflux system membrane fusion protein
MKKQGQERATTMNWIKSLRQRPSKLISLLVLTCLAGGGWYWYAGAARRPDQNAQRLITITRGTIEEVVTSQGKLEAKQYVDVGTQVSGQIKNLHVEIGDAVKQGQLLAEIDPRVYQAQVEANEARLNSLRAQLNQQKAQLTLAEQNLKRNRDLIAVDAVSRQALQETESEAAVAKAQVASIQAQIQETESNIKGNKTNLSFTKIYAPMSGTVTTRPAREGQTLNANQSTPTILQIADLDTMTVRAQVAEADVTKLKEGMPVYFTTLGNSERRWQGTVRQILPSPQIINEVVLYDVLIDVRNEDRQLMTGMTAQVFFIFGRAENAVIAPAEALTRRVAEQDNESGKAYRVTVLTGQDREQRVIHVGLQTRAQAEVTAGLNPGDRILLNRPQEPGAATAPNSAARGGNNTRRFNRGPQL